MPQPLTHAQLIQRLQSARAQLESLLAPLTDAQMKRRGVQDDYSIRDIIAHITVWDRRGTSWIKDIAAGANPAIPTRDHTWADVDWLNAQTYRAHRSRPPRQVLAESRRAFTRLLKQVEALKAEDLTRTVRIAPRDKRLYALWEIVAWRYKHMHAHGRPIRKWIKTSQHSGAKA